MRNWRAYAKCLVAIAGAVLSAIITAYGVQPWMTVVASTLTAIMVYAIPNIPGTDTPTEYEPTTFDGQ